MKTTTTAEGEKAQQHGQAVAEVAQSNATAVEAKGLQIAAESSQKGKAQAEVQSENAQTQSKTVVEAAQETQAAGQEKGKQVKEVASAKAKAKPAEVSAKGEAASKARVGGASRSAGVMRASSATNAGVGAGVGAAKTNVGGAVNNTTRVVTPSQSNRPVQVGGAVNVGAGSRIKVGD